jgi:dual-specificity kinase
MAAVRKRKRNGTGDESSSEDSEIAEERAEHHYMLRKGDEFDHGRYVVVRQLGNGTFGRVVEMFDTTEKRDVAVKVIRAVEKCVLHLATS